MAEVVCPAGLQFIEPPRVRRQRSRIRPNCFGDLQKQLAKLRLVVGAYLLGQKLLRGRGVLLRLYLVPLRQNLAPGVQYIRVLCDGERVPTTPNLQRGLRVGWR
jgi:hypothetical protein